MPHDTPGRKPGVFHRTNIVDAVNRKSERRLFPSVEGE